MTQSAPPRLTRTIGRLALALLNATLILVVLALFFAWRLVGAVERVTDTAISAATEQVAELTSLRAEITGLREQFANIEGDASSSLAKDVEPALVRLDRIEAQLSGIRSQLGSSVDAVTADPGIIVDRAVATGIAEFARWLGKLSDCDLSNRS